MNPLLKIEQETLDEGRELTRRMLEERLQAAVDEIGAISPVSGLKLKRARRIDLKLHKAEAIYVVQDGAIWLWNIFEDRFSTCASGVLDFYHASDHLQDLWAA